MNSNKQLNKQLNEYNREVWNNMKKNLYWYQILYIELLVIKNNIKRKLRSRGKQWWQ